MTQIWVFGSFFCPLPHHRGGEGVKKYSTGPQLSEYVQNTKYEWNLLKIGFKNTYFQVFQRFPAITASSQISQIIDQIWVNFGQKGPFFKFPWKTKAVIFFGLQTIGFLQKIREFQCAVFEKMLQTPIFGHFGPKKVDFGPFLAKKVPFSNFRWKSENITFLLIFFIFQYKKSENSNVRIFRKMGTYVRTNERTYGSESKGPSTSSRDQKLVNLHTNRYTWKNKFSKILAIYENKDFFYCLA